jgi:hypothetical protein
MRAGNSVPGRLETAKCTPPHRHHRIATPVIAKSTAEGKRSSLHWHTLLFQKKLQQCARPCQPLHTYSDAWLSPLPLPPAPPHQYIATCVLMHGHTMLVAVPDASSYWDNPKRCQQMHMQSEKTLHMLCHWYPSIASCCAQHTLAPKMPHSMPWWYAGRCCAGRCQQKRAKEVCLCPAHHSRTGLMCICKQAAPCCYGIALIKRTDILTCNQQALLQARVSTYTSCYANRRYANQCCST